MRVAWFGHASGLRADGLSAYSSATVLGLRSRGVDVQFYSHKQDGDVAPATDVVQLRALRFKTLTVPTPGSLASVGAALRRFSPHVIHLSVSFSLLEGNMVGLATQLGIPVVATIHLPYGLDHSARGRVLKSVYRFHARWLVRCQRLIALSEQQGRLLVEVGCSPDRITVLPNAVDIASIKPGPSAFRASLGAHFIVAYMGRMDREKRVVPLIKSFLQLGWPADHVLILIGAGTQDRHIRRLSIRHPQVRMVGLVSDPRVRIDLLRAADVFVLPSTAEGLSLALLEAMAAGCAIIATDAGDDGAAVADAGIHLPVYPLEPGLGDAMRTLRDDHELRMDLRRRARDRASAGYSLEARIDSLLALYAELRNAAALTR